MPLSGQSASTVPTPTPVLSPTPASVSTQPGIIITRILTVGSRGGDVTLLQNFFINQGFLAQGNNTGYFGPLTQQALKDYQCARQIVCTGSPSSTGWGVVGPKTRSSLAKGTGFPSSPLGLSLQEQGQTLGQTLRTQGQILGSSLQLQAAQFSPAQRQELILKLQEQIRQLQLQLEQLRGRL